MRRRLLLFLVTIDFVLVCAFAYCWGGGLVQFLGQNLSLKFYNGVLNLYVPGVLGAQEEGIPNIYRDVTASMYPAIAQNEQRLWYESQEENLAYYENQAAEENEQAKSELEQAKKNVTVADDACSKAQTEYDALVQAWKEKQAAAAALNEKLQAAQSCDWENGDEFDEALEQSDERF